MWLPCSGFYYRNISHLIVKGSAVLLLKRIACPAFFRLWLLWLLVANVGCFLADCLCCLQDMLSQDCEDALPPLADMLPGVCFPANLHATIDE